MRAMEGWRKATQWLLAPEPATSHKYAGHLAPRWIFLRGLGLIYFSAFYPLLFQIKGLIGPEGILPASKYLELVDKYRSGFEHFWIAPTLFWLPQDKGPGGPFFLGSWLLIFQLPRKDGRENQL